MSACNAWRSYLTIFLTITWMTCWDRPMDEGKPTIDFWELPLSSLNQMQYYASGKEIHIVWQYTRRERFLRPRERDTLQMFAPHLLGLHYQAMCSRWATNSATLIPGYRVVEQVRKGHMYLCRHCRYRLGDKILDSSIEWMIGRGRWVPGDSMGFVKVDDDSERGI
jgi:hypothetical protein